MFTNDVPAPDTGVTRRSLIALAAGVATLGAGAAGGGASPAGAAGAAAAPTGAPPAFLALSRAITGYSDLNPTTADRIYAGLIADDAATAAALQQLMALAERTPQAQDLQAQARQGGQGEVLTALLSAWYTGTVVGKSATTVVAYREALMYRPTEDGLTVPTYCNKGPMWWQDALPPGVARQPVNTPKVL